MFSMATVRTRSFSTFDEDFFLPHTWTPNFPRVSWTLMLISSGSLGLVLWASCCSSLQSPLTAAHENHINHILAHAGHVSCRQPYLLFKLMNRCSLTIRDRIVYLSRNNWIDYSLSSVQKIQTVIDAMNCYLRSLHAKHSQKCYRLIPAGGGFGERSVALWYRPWRYRWRDASTIANSTSFRVCHKKTRPVRWNLYPSRRAFVRSSTVLDLTWRTWHVISQGCKCFLVRR